MFDLESDETTLRCQACCTNVGYADADFVAHSTRDGKHKTFPLCETCHAQLLTWLNPKVKATPTVELAGTEQMAERTASAAKVPSGMAMRGGF